MYVHAHRALGRVQQKRRNEGPLRWVRARAHYKINYINSKSTLQLHQECVLYFDARKCEKNASERIWYEFRCGILVALLLLWNICSCFSPFAQEIYSLCDLYDDGMALSLFIQIFKLFHIFGLCGVPTNANIEHTHTHAKRIHRHIYNAAHSLLPIAISLALHSHSH